MSSLPLPPDTLSRSKYVENAFAAGASPGTPLWELSPEPKLNLGQQAGKERTERERNGKRGKTGRKGGGEGKTYGIPPPDQPCFQPLSPGYVTGKSFIS